MISLKATPKSPFSPLFELFLPFIFVACRNLEFTGFQVYRVKLDDLFIKGKRRLLLFLVFSYF